MVLGVGSATELHLHPFLFSFWDRALLSCGGWSRTHNLLRQPPKLLVLQACATGPGSILVFTCRSCTQEIIQESPLILYLALVNLKWFHPIPSCCWQCSCSSRNLQLSLCGWWNSRCWRYSCAHQSWPGWASRYYLTGRKMHRLKKLQPTLAELGENQWDFLWSKRYVCSLVFPCIVKESNCDCLMKTTVYKNWSLDPRQGPGPGSPEHGLLMCANNLHAGGLHCAGQETSSWWPFMPTWADLIRCTKPWNLL